jgi:hypothetical protein
MALSSIGSARSFLSLAFSCFSAFSRLASDTSRPPFFAFHLQKVALLIRACGRHPALRRPSGYAVSPLAR